MEIKQHTITTIYASEGMKLTNGNAYLDAVSLGALDSPENWHEITLEEYNKIQEEVEQNVNFEN